MDDDDDIEVPGLGRRKSKVASSSGGGGGGGGGMGAGAVVGLSLVTSVLASAGTVIGLSKSGMLAPTVAPIASVAAPSEQPSASASASSAPTAAPSASASASASASVGDVRVPDLVRVPLANARSVADALGLRIVERERRADPAVPADSIAAQSPLPGSNVSRGGAIDVFISSGPAAGASAAPVASAAASAAPTATASAALDPANTVEVPRFVGQRIQRARPAVTAAGLVLGAQREIFDEDHGPHAVLRQSIAAGTRVPRGTSIDLVYNQGE